MGKNINNTSELLYSDKMEVRSKTKSWFDQLGFDFLPLYCMYSLTPAKLKSCYIYIKWTTKVRPNLGLTNLKQRIQRILSPIPSISGFDFLPLYCMYSLTPAKLTSCYIYIKWTTKAGQNLDLTSLKRIQRILTRSLYISGFDFLPLYCVYSLTPRNTTEHL